MVENGVRHFVDVRQLSPDFLFDTFQEMNRMTMSREKGLLQDPGLRGWRRLGYTLFSVPSEITESSFAMAFHNLGWGRYDVKLPVQTSWTESWEEHRIIVAGEQRFDAIILRSQHVGGAEKHTKYSKIPILNAGEGFNSQGGGILYFPQHPLQAVADGFTVFERLGRLDNIHFVITGDIRANPVANSWVCTFALFPNARITLATEALPNKLNPQIETYLQQKGVRIERVDAIDQVLPEADVWCIAHSQNTIRSQIPTMTQIGPQRLELLSSRAIVIHDLTKGVWPEVAEGVKDDPKFAHRQQIKNGPLAGMYFLQWVTGS